MLKITITKLKKGNDRIEYNNPLCGHKQVDFGINTKESHWCSTAGCNAKVIPPAGHLVGITRYRNRANFFLTGRIQPV